MTKNDASDLGVTAGGPKVDKNGLLRVRDLKLWLSIGGVLVTLAASFTWLKAASAQHERELDRRYPIIVDTQDRARGNENDIKHIQLGLDRIVAEQQAQDQKLDRILEEVRKK